MMSLFAARRAEADSTVGTPGGVRGGAASMDRVGGLSG